MEVEQAKKVSYLKYLLSTAFLAGLSIRRSMWQQIVNTLFDLKDFSDGEALAKIVIESTFQHELALNYPINFAYAQSVLTFFRKIWNDNSWKGVSQFKENNCSDDFKTLEIGYKSYSTGMKEIKYITLLESFEGIARGTTGLSSWGAAKVLSDWCLENLEVIREKHIVELGAGIGHASSLILASVGASNRPVTYTATDCHPHVLSILHHNLSLLKRPKKQTQETLKRSCIEMNNKMVSEELSPGEFQTWSPEPSFKLGSTNIQVSQLDWRNPGLDFPACEVILAADVVYAVHLFPDLVKVIRTLLIHSSKHKFGPNQDSVENVEIEKENTVKTLQENFGNKEAENFSSSPTCSNLVTPDPVRSSQDTNHILHTPIAIVACTMRSRETIERFLHELSKQNLEYKKVFQTTLDKHNSLFAYDESYKPVQVYKITLGNL